MRFALRPVRGGMGHRRLLVVPALALPLLAAAPAHGKPGDLDRTFAHGGRVAFKVWDSGGTTTGLALRDGRRPLLAVDAYRVLDEAPAWLQLTAGGRLA